MAGLMQVKGEKTMKNGICTDSIKAAYGEKVIIEELSISIPMGQITTIIGPNGCGKSTFLKTLGRILGIKKGCIYLDGEEIHKLPTRELAKKLAILPQTPQAPDGLTVEELVSYGRFPYQKGLGRLTEEDKGIVAWAIEATGLKGLEGQATSELSGGQRQRVWIAMALAQETEVILLDEPTTYLDMAYQLEILELLEDLNKEHGCTILMVLHDLNLASKFADHMIAFREGRVVKAGTPCEVMNNETLKEVFEIDAAIVTDPLSSRPVCMSYQLLSKAGNKGKVKKGA